MTTKTLRYPKVVAMIILMIATITSPIIISQENGNPYWYEVKRYNYTLVRILEDYIKVFPELIPKPKYNTIAYLITYKPIIENSSLKVKRVTNIPIWIYQLWDYGAVPKTKIIVDNLVAKGFLEPGVIITMCGGITRGNIKWIIFTIQSSRHVALNELYHVVIIAAWNKEGKITSTEIRIEEVYNTTLYRGRNLIISLANLSKVTYIEAELYIQYKNKKLNTITIEKQVNTTLSILRELIKAIIEGNEKSYEELMDKYIDSLSKTISTSTKVIGSQIDYKIIKDIIIKVIKHEDLYQLLRSIRKEIKAVTTATEITETSSPLITTTNKNYQATTITKTSGSTNTVSTREGAIDNTILLLALPIVVLIPVITCILFKRRKTGK